MIFKKWIGNGRTRCQWSTRTSRNLFSISCYSLASSPSSSDGEVPQWSSSGTSYQVWLSRESHRPSVSSPPLLSAMKVNTDTAILISCIIARKSPSTEVIHYKHIYWTSLSCILKHCDYYEPRQQVGRRTCRQLIPQAHSTLNPHYGEAIIHGHIRFAPS